MIDLIKLALEYKEKAYVPYSNFRVGAAVRFESGNVYGGCNIENVSFGATNCAERTAIFSGIKEGEKIINEIAIVADSEELIAPCGICRQVIVEFSTEDTKIILAKNEEEYIIKTVEEIMPGAFTKDFLK